MPKQATKYLFLFPFLFLFGIEAYAETYQQLDSNGAGISLQVFAKYNHSSSTGYQVGETINTNPAYINYSQCSSIINEGGHALKSKIHYFKISGPVKKVKWGWRITSHVRGPVCGSISGLQSIMQDLPPSPMQLNLKCKLFPPVYSSKAKLSINSQKDQTPFIGQYIVDE